MPFHRTRKPKVAAGGGVHGSLYVDAGTNAVEVSLNASQARIFLPDIKVYLRNMVTGVDSAPVVTDLFGRYAFPTQPPGRYILRWRLSSAGLLPAPNPIVIAAARSTRFPRESWRTKAAALFTAGWRSLTAT